METPGLTVGPVRDARDRADFVNLPYQLYRRDPRWVAPLRGDQRRLFDPAHNPVFDHLDHELFLVRDQGLAVGRIAVFSDRLYESHWNERLGFFGSYECIDDRCASRLLLGAAEDWLRARDYPRMRGPVNFQSQEWGFVAEGFHEPHTVMSPHNPPYYNDQLVEFGFGKVKDLLVYDIDDAWRKQLPERFRRHAESIARAGGVTVRRANMKDFDAEVRTVVRIANESTGRNWGFVPVTDAEAAAIGRDLKLIIDPELVLFACVGDRPIAYMIAFPDVNLLLHGLNGRLFPFGIFKLLFGIKSVRSFRIWGLGIVPEYWRRGIDTLLYIRIYEVCQRRKVERLEANYVLENNAPMNAAIRNLGFVLTRRIRVYEKAIG